MTMTGYFYLGISFYHRY